MKIKAQIVADSVNEFGNRITTFVLTYPRIIHAELLTHRMFSRNAASSRAVPFEKLCESVMNNPFIPIAWQKDHKGMQGTTYFIEPAEIETLTINHLRARNAAVEQATAQSEFGLTKQICNRYLEPYQWYQSIITATELENFFALRCPQYTLEGMEFQGVFRSRKDVIKSVGDSDGEDYFSRFTEIDWLEVNKGMAEIHLMALAEAMYDSYQESIPKELKAGDWHIPFGDQIDENLIFMTKDLVDERTGAKTTFTLKPAPNWEGTQEEIDSWYQKQKIKIATARCARISYTVVGEEDKVANYENDIKLHDRLAASGHWSPFEHIAKAMNPSDYTTHINGRPTEYGFNGNTKKVTAIFHQDKDDQMLGWSGNLKGFIQYRKLFSNENHHQATYAQK